MPAELIRDAWDVVWTRWDRSAAMTQRGPNVHISFKSVRNAVAAAVVTGAVVAAVVAPAANARIAPTKPAWVTAHGADTEVSGNWSGYAVNAPDNKKITRVQSTFVMPATNNLIPGFAATWAGIGGLSSQDLIQAGVEEDYFPLIGSGYYAWYEILPASETPITSGCLDGAHHASDCAVTPGDTVAIDIVESSPGSNVWRVSLNDIGKWTFAKTIPYTSTHSSAEYVFESVSMFGLPLIVPSIGNSVFGPFKGTPGNTFSVNGARPTLLGNGSPISIEMQAAFVLPEAAPSAIASDHNSFTACAYTLLTGACPTPVAAKRH